MINKSVKDKDRKEEIIKIDMIIKLNKFLLIRIYLIKNNRIILIKIIFK